MIAGKSIYLKEYRNPESHGHESREAAIQHLYKLSLAI